MTPLRLMVYRHSAFYSPLIGGIAGGFFAEEGFAPTYTVVPAGKTVAQFIASGEIDVTQTAVSASWSFLERGKQPPFLHFAQINQRDGFLVAARRPDPVFSWDKLLSGSLMCVHGGQPEAMLAYAMHKKGLALSIVRRIDAGGTAQMLASFRAGQGDYFHEQAPYPQQLEQEGVAHIVASVGEVIGPVAFSSLAASREWLGRSEARRFMRAYRKARDWVHGTSPAQVADAEASFFPGIDQAALEAAIEYYQRLGCWDGMADIDSSHYEVALDVFSHSKLISRRHPYREVVVSPPDA